MRLYYCAIFVLFLSVKSEEVTTKNPDYENEFRDIFPNITTTTPKPNKTIEMHRIIQPTQPASQTQQIERTIDPSSSKSSINATIDNSIKNSQQSSEFKPSPHLETYYEYNKFPVPPAFPEAKHYIPASSWNFGEQQQQHQQFPVLQHQWPPIREISTPATTETNDKWTARVKFPEAQIPTNKDCPYQFEKSPPSSSGKSFPASFPKKTSFGGIWDKFESVSSRPLIMHKNQFDFTAPVKIPADDGHYIPKSNYGEYSLSEKPHHEMMQHGNPWKKIIKFLTAFIPIGLLISALTPTVITVSPMNGTQTRLRSEDGSSDGKKFVSSLTYLTKLNSFGCEDRILCELLLSASTSKNAEDHVNNLLDTFAKDGKAVERAEEMKKVFDAVKHQDCSPIICKSIRENT